MIYDNANLKKCINYLEKLKNVLIEYRGKGLDVDAKPRIVITCLNNEAYIRIGYSGTHHPFKRSSLLELQDAHPLHYFIFVPREGFEPSIQNP